MINLKSSIGSVKWCEMQKSMLEQSISESIMEDMKRFIDVADILLENKISFIKYFLQNAIFINEQIDLLLVLHCDHQ